MFDVKHLLVYRHSGQLIIDVTYGIVVTSSDNKLIHIAEELMNNVTIGLTPVFWIFDPVPISVFSFSHVNYSISYS
jgi:hypothetical protein